MSDRKIESRVTFFFHLRTVGVFYKRTVSSTIAPGNQNDQFSPSFLVWFIWFIMIQAFHYIIAIRHPIFPITAGAYFVRESIALYRVVSGSSSASRLRLRRLPKHRTRCNSSLLAREIRRSWGRARMIHSCHRTAASRNSKVSRSERRGPADVRPAFARSWEMSSLNGGARGVPFFFLPSFPLLNLSLSLSLPSNWTRALSTLFSVSSRLTVSSVFEEIMRQRIRAVSRNSARQRPRGAPRSSTRGYIRLRRFLRSHSYPCENDKTDGALLLKSHRVSRIRWNLWELSSCAPSPSPFVVGGWFISNGLVSSGRRNVDATFWRTLSCIRRCTSLGTARNINRV